MESARAEVRMVEASRIFGVKNDTLQTWAARGCPHRRENRFWYFETAKVFRWRIEYERQRMLRQANGQDPDGDEGDTMLSLENERALLAREQRKEKARQNAEAEGKLIDAEDLRITLARVFGALREKVLQNPDLEEEDKADMIEGLREAVLGAESEPEDPEAEESAQEEE